jgi:hypothetical protein
MTGVLDLSDRAKDLSVAAKFHRPPGLAWAQKPFH